MKSFFDGYKLDGYFDLKYKIYPPIDLKRYGIPSLFGHPKRGYHENKKEKPSIHLIRGKAVHDAIAQFHKIEVQESKDSERTKSELLSLFNHSRIAQGKQIEALGLPESTLNEYYNENTDMLLGWLRRNLPSLQDGRLRPQRQHCR